MGLIFLYFAVAFLSFVKALRGRGSYLFSLLLLVHTGGLVWYSFFVKRPPVATMQETFFYVAWIVALAIFFLKKHLERLSVSKGTACIVTGGEEVPLKALISTGSLSCGFLLLLAASFTSLKLELEPVLNAPLWLMIHVMVIVASYGLLLISALISHAYLINEVIAKLKVRSLSFATTLNQKEGLMKLLFFCNFAGVGLLTIGTILGGMWASRTWGSFWSWDVKESWAFISICIYLSALHMHSFKTSDFSVISLISSVGFLSITFTWYGINYVLKKGMHTYGFGDGGVLYYLLFLIGDFLLLLFLGGVIKLKVR